METAADATRGRRPLDGMRNAHPIDRDVRRGRTSRLISIQDAALHA
jgi:hypothetical protein